MLRARGDIAQLTTRGYTQTKLDALQGYRTQLAAEGADARAARTRKKSARSTEIAAVREGKLLVRSGHAMIFNAIADRTPAHGETPAQSAEIVAALATRLDAVSGRIGDDPVKLRTKLTDLTALLADPLLASHERAVTHARHEFLAKVQAAITDLPVLSTDKTQAQQASVQGTADLDEIDGRAYFNMKQLTQAGRHFWLEHHDRERASHYRLDTLHAHAAAHAPAAPPAAPTAPPTPTG